MSPVWWDQKYRAEIEKRLVELDTENKALKAALKIMEHKVIACGVAADHPNAALTLDRSKYPEEWESPQLERVRALRAELEKIKRPCVVRRGHEEEDLRAHGDTVLCSTQLLVMMHREREKLEQKLKDIRMCHGPTEKCEMDSGECGICSVLDCPGGELLHYHHDGCPFCYTEDK